MAAETNYKTFPALAQYIDRIGAEQLTFRSFMIKEHRANAYYIERCLIRIDAEGEISVTNKDHAPTKDEAEAIKREIIGKDFPKHVNATEAQCDKLRAKLSKREGVLHFFECRRKGGFIMAQERRIDENGDKQFYPWTMWSDGEWRCMEPDTGLPFWKPKVRKTRRSARSKVKGDDRGGYRIMIHEGAKTADFIDDLIHNPDRAEELSKHPYGEVFVKYEHWGMIGGALAPHRADYTELYHAKPDEVVYVCDNDYAGINALKHVSRHYGRALMGVRFDNNFPTAFDFADKMPEDQFAPKTGVWKGPTWKDLLLPATHATEQVPNPAGTGRPLTQLSHDFKSEWVYSIKPEVFVHKAVPDKQWSADEFNTKLAPFSHADDLARLIKKELASQACVLSYNPARPPGIYGKDGGNYINTHVPSQIKPEKGDVKPWLEYLEYLIPVDEDREHLMRWVATLIARPDIKMNYGVLLISETQGVGKSTLGEKVLTPLLGFDNVSFPGESQIVDSAYNYWAAHKRLAVVHEIYAGHSARAYNKLKNLITDRDITVQKKYQADYQIENYIHVLACSNSMRALQVSSDDRRWFVPKLTENKNTLEFWTKFNRWLTDDKGHAKILQWALDFVEKHDPVPAGADAPLSGAKRDLVEEGYSPGMQLVAHTLDTIRAALEGDSEANKAKRAALEKAGQLKDGKVIIVDVDFVKLIRDRIHEGRQNDRTEKPLTIRKVAKARGWYALDDKLPFKGWGERYFRARLIVLDPALTHSSKVPEGLQPLALEQFVAL